MLLEPLHLPVKFDEAARAGGEAEKRARKKQQKAAVMTAVTEMWVFIRSEVR